MPSDIAKAFIETYKIAKSPSLNRVSLVKKGDQFSNKLDTIRVYTDGSAKGLQQSEDGKSFAGWGIHYVISGGSTNKQYSREGSKLGNLFNSDSYEAELRAVVEALTLVKYKVNIELVTDCGDVVEGLANMRKTMKMAYGRPGFEHPGSSFDPQIYRIQKLWKQIGITIDSDNINSLSVKWVRSHHYEKYAEFGLTESSFEADDHKVLFRDCKGNYLADRNAMIGSIKAVRGALYKLQYENDDKSALDFSLATVKKNLACSSFARDEAIRYLSEHDKNFLPKSILVEILDDYSLKKIDQLRAMIAGGNRPDDVFESNLVHGCVISSSDPINRQLFMRKVKEHEPSWPSFSP